MECPVSGCTTHHSIEYVMCGRCWKQVSSDLKAAVYRAWNARKRFPGDERRVAEHENAKRLAVAHVERRRGLRS